MTAVAVWDREPTPLELLDDRLALGWRPVPSPMSDGPTILGVAAGWRERVDHLPDAESTA